MDLVSALRQREPFEMLFDRSTGKRIPVERMIVDDHGVVRYAHSGRKVPQSYVARLDVALQRGMSL